MNSQVFVNHLGETVTINIEYNSIFDEKEDHYVVLFTVGNTRGDFCDKGSFTTSEKSVDQGINDIKEKYRKITKTISILNDYSCFSADGGDDHIPESMFEYVAKRIVDDM
jgi:hypothetical protein